MRADKHRDCIYKSLRTAECFTRRCSVGMYNLGMYNLPQNTFLPHEIVSKCSYTS
jgi:hypothetical protein